VSVCAIASAGVAAPCAQNAGPVRETPAVAMRSAHILKSQLATLHKKPIQLTFSECVPDECPAADFHFVFSAAAAAAIASACA